VREREREFSFGRLEFSGYFEFIFWPKKILISFFEFVPQENAIIFAF
jgi:hypothetical protein